MTVVDEINTKNALRITNAWLSEVQYEAPYFGCRDMEAIKKALEKQIPKDVIFSDDGDALLCPNCEFDLMGYSVDEENPCYCPKCGQALKWGEEDD